MVQLMKTTKDSPESQLQERGKMALVKREMTEESNQYDERLVPLNKRSKGGNVDHLHKLLSVGSSSQVLYVGDHIYGDILRSKKVLGWRMMLVVPELEKEVKVLASSWDTCKLTRQPLFFRETNPQPRKHTLWQATTFSGGKYSDGPNPADEWFKKGKILTAKHANLLSTLSIFFCWVKYSHRILLGPAIKP